MSAKRPTLLTFTLSPAETAYTARGLELLIRQRRLFLAGLRSIDTVDMTSAQGRAMTDTLEEIATLENYRDLCTSVLVGAGYDAPDFTRERVK